jgi:hypothetical protein
MSWPLRLTRMQPRGVGAPGGAGLRGAPRRDGSEEWLRDGTRAVLAVLDRSVILFTIAIATLVIANSTTRTDRNGQTQRRPSAVDSRLSRPAGGDRKPHRGAIFWMTSEYAVADRRVYVLPESHRLRHHVASRSTRHLNFCSA